MKDAACSWKEPLQFVVNPSPSKPPLLVSDSGSLKELLLYLNLKLTNIVKKIFFLKG